MGFDFVPVDVEWEGGDDIVDFANKIAVVLLCVGDREFETIKKAFDQTKIINISLYNNIVVGQGNVVA